MLLDSRLYNCKSQKLFWRKLQTPYLFRWPIWIISNKILGPVLEDIIIVKVRCNPIIVVLHSKDIPNFKSKIYLVI